MLKSNYYCNEIENLHKVCFMICCIAWIQNIILEHTRILCKVHRVIIIEAQNTIFEKL